MNSFFKDILSSAIGVILALFMFIGSMFLLITIGAFISPIFSKEGKVDPNSIIKIKFDYQISDKPNDDPFINFKPGGSFKSNNTRHLYKILEAIESASNNKNVAGIVLDLENFTSPGVSSLKEIRDALKKFRKSDKFIYSYATIFTQTGYYLASVADSIFLYPTGVMELSGLSTTIPFFTETMSEMGLKPEIIRHGKFKAAVEPFMLTEMSEENREQTIMLLDDIWMSMLKDISQSRDIRMDSLNILADNLITSIIPEKAVSAGLIDKLLYRDEFTSFLSKKLKQDEDDIEFVSLNKLKSNKKKSKNKIAIIYAEGDIGMGDNGINSKCANILKETYEDDDINAIVFRVNSPGGSALISDEILSQIKLSKNDKPIVVSMGNYAASGGYYISCAADKIFALPTTITGSIGVFGLYLSAKELLSEKMKLHFDNVKTNEFSDMGASFILPIESLSDKERELIQTVIEKIYDDFINHVSKGRDMTADEVDAIGQGRVWSGLQAKKIGLVDSIGGLKDAIQCASQLAKIDDFKIVELPKAKDGLEAILDNIASKIDVFSDKNIEQIYLNSLKEKILNMQGIQARLPVKYNIE